VIRDAYKKAADEGIDTRAIVIINPGNPTGSSLAEEEIKDVLKFAAEKKLVVMADEVYQTNVFIGKFTSFKKVLRELQKEEPGKYDNVELASLHSVSKGMVGECGHRGGYYEMVGFDPEVVAQIYKFVSIQLCPPVIGQCIVECMTHPPVEGEPSYELYKKEYDAIFEGLKVRANALYDAFKGMEGVSCQTPAVSFSTPPSLLTLNYSHSQQGSMYLFPTITLSEKAIAAAKEAGNAPDEFYCLKLLDATGVCLVPGSGFGQKEGTFHFRTTFLAPGTDWVGRISKFHKDFMDQYR
jgi:alanine transaminase